MPETSPDPAPDPSVADHRARVLDALSALGRTEVVPVADAFGRVLAADVTAALAVPPFDHSAMDGFAVRAAEVARVPVALPVAGTIAAGDPTIPLPAGTAIRIMTGAAIPPGADLVVPFEWTSGSDPVTVQQSAAAGRHIRQEGEDVAAGAVALRAGTVLGPAQIGLLASIGRSDVVLAAGPRLAVISTGAELVDRLVPDSNTATLLAAGRAVGATATGFGPVPDEPAALREQLARAAEVADIVVTTGGISAGDHDVVKAALREEPGFWFGPVAMKPGRPQGHGVLTASDGRRVPVVTLPGTPVAAYASFLLYVVPALRRLAGQPDVVRTAELGVEVEAGDRTVLLPAHLADGLVVPLPGHAGHSQRLLATADALLVVPPLGRVVPHGEQVEVLLLHPEEGRTWLSSLG